MESNKQSFREELIVKNDELERRENNGDILKGGEAAGDKVGG